MSDYQLHGRSVVWVDLVHDSVALTQPATNPWFSISTIVCWKCLTTAYVFEPTALRQPLLVYV